MKKVIDILPPKEKKELKLKKEILLFRKSEVKPKVRFFSPFTKILIFISIIIIIFATLHFNLASAKIEIWPKTEVLTFQTKIEVLKGAKEINFKNGVIPGKIFKIEKIFSGEFISSGEIDKSEKASGTIRVFNNSERPQLLIANTRFQAPEDKFQPPLEKRKKEYPWFRNLEKIVVPAKGYIDVKVIADSPGEKYNIEPTTFSIPGLIGTPQYTLVYGKSFQPMKGGILRKVPQVKEEDLEKAKQELLKKATQEREVIFRNEIPSDYEFFEKVSKTEILEVISPIKAGMEVEKFNYQIKVNFQILAFKKEDLENFAKEFITSQISNEKKIHQGSLKIKYFLNSFELDLNKMNLSLDLEAKIYSDIDLAFLKEGLAGKSLTEVRAILNDSPQISRSEIKVFPFWLKNIPKDLEKINLKLIVD